MAVDSPRLGRPRDARIDAAVVEATRELLVEVGYFELSIAAVALRAGATKPAIYRRWVSKAHLVHEAVFPADARIDVPHTGSFRGDVAAMVATAAAMFSAPVARAAIPGLLAEFAAQPTLHAELLGGFRELVWPEFVALINRAKQSGEARPDLDLDTLIETIGGSVLLSLLLRPDDTLDEAWISQTADLISRGAVL